MDVERVGTYEKPIPRPDGTEKPFWEGAAQGELRIQRCSDCGHRQHYPRALCTQCGGTPSWEIASGHGNVHTFTVVRQNGAKPFRDELPYVVAIIELAEGVRMMGNVTDCAPEDVHIGLAVRAYAIEIEDGIAIPYWRPSSQEGR